MRWQGRKGGRVVRWERWEGSEVGNLREGNEVGKVGG